MQQAICSVNRTISLARCARDAVRSARRLSRSRQRIAEDAIVEVNGKAKDEAEKQIDDWSVRVDDAAVGSPRASGARRPVAPCWQRAFLHALGTT